MTLMNITEEILTVGGGGGISKVSEILGVFIVFIGFFFLFFLQTSKKEGIDNFDRLVAAYKKKIMSSAVF